MIHKQDNQNIMSQNVELIKEIQELRKRKKDLTTKLKKAINIQKKQASERNMLQRNGQLPLSEDEGEAAAKDGEADGEDLIQFYEAQQEDAEQIERLRSEVEIKQAQVDFKRQMLQQKLEEAQELAQ